jgi:hypothetical protein
MNIMSLLVGALWLIPCVFILIIGQWGLVQVSESNISLFTNIATIAAVFATSLLCFWTRKTFSKNDENRKAWMFIAIGAIVWGIGQAVLTVYESFPSWAFVADNYDILVDVSDFFYIFSVPFIMIGFYHLSKALKARIPTFGWIIGGVVLVGTLIISYFSNWYLLFPAQASEALRWDGFIDVLLYATFYPIMLTYAAMTVSILFTGIAGRPWMYVISGFIIYGVGDMVWNWITRVDPVTDKAIYTVGSYWDLLWIVGFGLIAIGAIENYYLFKKSYY